MTGIDQNNPSVSHPNNDRFPEQDEQGVDLSLLKENLKLTPTERIRRADKARRDTLRLMEYSRRHLEKRD